MTDPLGDWTTGLNRRLFQMPLKAYPAEMVLLQMAVACWFCGAFAIVDGCRTGV